MAKKLKMNFKKVLTKSAVIAVTGAASQVIATVVEGELDTTTSRPKNAEMVDYGMIAAGILLPEFVKNDMVNDASSALLAIGVYRMAIAKNWAGKIGVNGIGMPGNDTIGAQLWNPRRSNKKVSGTYNGSQKTAPSGTMG